jgi:hypothetical protein
MEICLFNENLNQVFNRSKTRKSISNEIFNAHVCGNVCMFKLFFPLLNIFLVL